MGKKRIALGFAVLCFAAYSLGCATTSHMAAHSYPALGPAPPPTPGHALKVDDLLVVADVSRSMKVMDKAGAERSLLSSFNQGIPEGLKDAGMRTFGKSAYDHTVLVQPLQSYDRSVYAERIGALRAGCGNTPLASALWKALDDLEGREGDIALLIVSDGENLSRDPIAPALALGEAFGSHICIYTVHVGESEVGRQALENIVKHIGCGKAVTAEELSSAQGMKDFITEIFYAHVHRDADRDGVFDQFDECPDTPSGVKVDKVGCPLDSDGDGVADYLDKCPDTPKGETVDKKGCPLDSDGDGVADYKDKCPDTPKGVKVDGNGCPLDSDGDGVPDYLDKCPDTLKGAPVNSVGCWTIKGINFDYDKWDIKPQYHGVLDENVRVLKMNPSVKVEIQGHTDSKGSEAYNQTLSEKRAESVKAYFVSKGISAERMSTRGLGELNPVASNATAEGRAQNRRIEIKIISR